jgi:hypothetical protein
VGVLALVACGGSDDSSGGSDDSSNESVADSADSSGGSVADSADDSSMMMVMDRTTRPRRVSKRRVSISTWTNSRKPSQASVRATVAVS